MPKTVAAQMPDAILISATGGDSALALYDQLSAIAPTLVINYDDQKLKKSLLTQQRITGPGETGRRAAKSGIWR